MVHGLTRARGFTQDDAHIYCTREQMHGRARARCCSSCSDLLRDYGLDDFYLELSTRNPDKSIGSDEDWERATDALREAAEACGLELVPDPGGAAFYAPEDLRAGQGRDRPHLADVDHPGRPRRCRTGSSWSTPRRTAPGSGR